jgi:hypothetical protein
MTSAPQTPTQPVRRASTSGRTVGLLIAAALTAGLASTITTTVVAGASNVQVDQAAQAGATSPDPRVVIGSNGGTVTGGGGTCVGCPPYAGDDAEPGTIGGLGGRVSKDILPVGGATGGETTCIGNCGEGNSGGNVDAGGKAGSRGRAISEGRVGPLAESD